MAAMLGEFTKDVQIDPSQGQRPPAVSPEYSVIETSAPPGLTTAAERAELADSGRLRPHVGAVYPLARTREAFGAKQRGVPGKVVITA